MAPCPCCDAPLRLNRGKNAPADPNHTWGRRILASLPEFQSQKSVVEQAILDRGHIVIYSPICHPEVKAGRPCAPPILAPDNPPLPYPRRSPAQELSKQRLLSPPATAAPTALRLLTAPIHRFTWGTCKAYWRRRTDRKARSMRANLDLVLSETVVTRNTILKYSRRARTYANVYRAMRDGDTDATQAAGGLAVVKALYEKQARKRRCHRSAYDQDRQYCEQQAARCALSQPVT